MSESEVSTSSTSFVNGATYSIKVSGSGALSVVPGKYNDHEVHMRIWEKARNQLWRAEANNDGFGFRNASTGKLLGVNKNGDISCDASDLNSWERFKFEGAGSGSLFSLIYNGSQQYLYQPGQWDSLQVTEHRSLAANITVTRE
ncbi:hypothetical protein N7509_012971 [Penicillium cosmopolitanum]|uniref:Ricin B lectin domain-containing protein n=1 Tax=Penicillium cosmopolitanum TaxID=1131564 RepID=A0A9W9SCX5_9EURO|nr:uncharacterized protein N7509_012971 [Penicillium cosmopolitanum]KAJ5376085.1 hypothetical protein N7509_012971 [Penicillium cosmopolitanum]